MLLDHFSRVYAVEPNDDMRNTAEIDLLQHPHFISVKGTAENTNIKSASVDLVVAAQAFHWFDRDSSRKEFQRILTGEKWVALIWNDRDLTGSNFQVDYEQMFQKFIPDYSKSSKRKLDPALISAFFLPNQYELHELSNRQIFDFESLRGRLLSSSYVPKEGQPGHTEIMKESKRIFDINQINNIVTIKYSTKIHVGKLA
jgi:ubiquinone/menaquinone biosynthesis C-methylase UbiE